MNDILLWVLMAGVLIVGEILTLSAVAGLLAGGAVAALVAATFTDNVPAELGVFVVVSAVLLVLVRPWALRFQQALSSRETSSIVGSEALVVEAVTVRGGQVRLNGELWRARADVETQELPVGTRVLVQAVDGATVSVFPANPFELS